MRKEKSEVRNKMVVIRVNEKEYKKLHSFFENSTCGSLSEYLRKVGLNKPIVVKYRNQTANEYLSVMLQIKKELNAIGNNFNQAIHKLHTLDRIPEFRSWIMLYEVTKQSVEKTIMHTSIQMHEIYQHLQTPDRIIGE